MTALRHLYLVQLIFVLGLHGAKSSVAPQQDGSFVELETAAPPFEAIPSGKRLTVGSMHQNMCKMDYAVRGDVVIAADKIQAQIAKEGKGNYPFDRMVFTNIGNPQSVGQKPLTWPRQVLALVELPDEMGVRHPDAAKIFPEDAIRRALEIKSALACGSSGCYSHSKGVSLFRQDVAQFLSKRDGGLDVDPEDIYLTNGASAGIVMCLHALIADSTCGVMIPIPQYPLYSATIDLLGGQKVGYYLNEKNGWDLDLEELERSLDEARRQGIRVTSLVLINPGNPTGQVLSRESLHKVVNFCARNKLVLLADEVYQENVYDENSEFVSCKRIAHDAGLIANDGVELVSFHSTSKGVFGECGRRGGFMEMIGIDVGVKDVLYKLASSSLCSCVSGQIMTSLMARGPDPDEESFASHENEKKSIFEGLKRRSQMVSKGLNAIPGFSCQLAQGAMYSFPRFELPSAAVRAAELAHQTPDTFYALSLLERTGICVVPASGFGQEKGRYGFRTTFLPSEEQMQYCVEKIRSHHEEFCAKYV